MDRAIMLPSWARTGNINVGLDFGTHSSKAVLRVRNAPNRASVLFLDEPGPEYPAFAAPSLVRLHAGKLSFGQRALEVSGGTLFSSLKVSLLPPPPHGPWNESQFPQGTTPSLLVALYLSWILGRIKEAVGKERAARLSLNVAAPMDHVENEALRDRYLHVVHAAWLATIECDTPPVKQGSRLTQVRPMFEEFLERPVPSRAQRRFEVLAETLAPLVSLFHNPQTREGLYLMADMGAGTTELSVSRVSRPGEDGAIVCYFDQTIRLGGNQFSDNDQQNDRSRTAHTRQERALKEELLREVRSVWYRGFAKDKDAGRMMKEMWKQLNVVLAGGGLRRQGLQSAIEASPPPRSIFLVDPIDYGVSWHRPAGLDFSGGPANFELRDPLDSPAYLAVAHGLSLERQRWPQFSFPAEVESLSRDQRIENPYERSYAQSDVG